MVGYVQSQVDHTLFVKQTQKGTTTVIVYIDDIVITGDYVGELEKLKSHFSSEFEVKHLRVLRYIIGIEVARSRKGIFISHRKAILDLLNETCLLGAWIIKTPIEVHHGLNDQDGNISAL